MPDGAPLPSVRTTCPYCGVGCGVRATPIGANEAAIAGDTEHPANRGRLCSKGSALGETLGLKGRLLVPVVHGQRSNWDTAMATVADGFRQAIDQHGPDSVAFYLSGQLLTEDYYVANKLMKGFIGSANVDTNSRLCMASAVAGHKRAFGSDTVPCTYEDLEETDLLVLVGSNLAWCHPVLFQRVAAAKERRSEMRIVVIDPRRTASCDIADLHLPLKPGSDIALWQGLFRELVRRGAVDQTFVEQHTSGFDAACEAAAGFDLTTVANATQLARSDLEAFYDSYVTTEKVVTVFSMGVNQAADGTDRVNAIINTHLATGRIGKPGAGPFSMTGQPNAMGGREVGGLANQLACHRDFDPASRDWAQRFWHAPRVAEKPGLKAVDLFEAVGRGQIKAIWIMATNPVVSMPDADAVRTALKACPLVVVSDIVPSSDTAQCADVLLPATGWGEKDGTVTNSERTISRQRAFLPAPGLARHDWRAICDLAKRLGFGEAFNFNSSAAIFREHATMTAFENDGSRDLDLGGLADLSDDEYDALEPVRWPVSRQGSDKDRFFADGQFYTDDMRGRFIVPKATKATKAADKTLPLTLNTGRVRDQWHTMTRTSRAARLNRHIAEPFMEIHPEDAERLAVKDAHLASIQNDRGQMVVRAVVTDTQQLGSVFVPMHWTDHHASTGRVDSLVAPLTDPVSGQPALKASTVHVRPYPVQWYGFASGITLETPATDYWARAATDRGERMELAGQHLPSNWRAFATQLLGLSSQTQIVESAYGPSGAYRFASFESGRLTGVLLMARGPVAAARDWLCDQIGRVVSGPDRSAILAGFPSAEEGDPGPTICSCMGVGRNTICDAIKQGAHHVDAVGDATGAGTQCGSCRPEIRKLMEELHVPA